MEPNKRFRPDRCPSTIPANIAIRERERERVQMNSTLRRYRVVSTLPEPSTVPGPSRPTTMPANNLHPQRSNENGREMPSDWNLPRLVRIPLPRFSYMAYTLPGPSTAPGPSFPSTMPANIAIRERKRERVQVNSVLGRHRVVSTLPQASTVPGLSRSTTMPANNPHPQHFNGNGREMARDRHLPRLVPILSPRYSDMAYSLPGPSTAPGPRPSCSSALPPRRSVKRRYTLEEIQAAETLFSMHNVIRINQAPRPIPGPAVNRPVMRIRHPLSGRPQYDYARRIMQQTGLPTSTTSSQIRVICHSARDHRTVVRHYHELADRCRAHPHRMYPHGGEGFLHQIPLHPLYHPNNFSRQPPNQAVWNPHACFLQLPPNRRWFVRPS